MTDYIKRVLHEMKEPLLRLSILSLISIIVVGACVAVSIIKEQTEFLLLLLITILGTALVVFAFVVFVLALYLRHHDKTLPATVNGDSDTEEKEPASFEFRVAQVCWVFCICATSCVVYSIFVKDSVDTLFLVLTGVADILYLLYRYH